MNIFRKLSGRCILRVLCLLLFLFPGQAYAQSLEDQFGFGPIEVTNQYLPDTLHATWTPRSPEVLGEGKSSVRTAFSWTTTNALLKERYLIDEENREFLVSYRYGISDDLEFAIDVPVLWRGGGVLDGFINGWHDFFGLPEGGRDKVVDDRYEVQGQLSNGERFQLDDEGTSLGNIRSRVRYALMKGGASTPALTLESGVSLPTAQEQFGADGLDFHVGVTGSKRILSELFFYFGSALFYYHDTDVHGLSYQPFHNEDFLALEWRILKSLSLQASLIYSTETVENITGHDDYSLYLDTGFSVALSERTLLDATVRENPGAADSSADVSFVFALRQKY